MPKFCIRAAADRQYIYRHPLIIEADTPDDACEAALHNLTIDNLSDWEPSDFFDPHIYAVYPHPPSPTNDDDLPFDEILYGPLACQDRCAAGGRDLATLTARYINHLDDSSSAIETNGDISGTTLRAIELLLDRMFSTPWRNNPTPLF